MIVVFPDHTHLLFANVIIVAFTAMVVMAANFWDGFYSNTFWFDGYNGHDVNLWFYLKF